MSSLNLQTFSILCIMRLISSQVNTNIEKLQDDFKDKARGFNYRMDWFKPDRMSTFAKFYLCVDIFQKQMNDILTGGYYEMNTSNHELPNFEGKLLKIKNVDVLYPTVLKHVIHCPLNLISFEKINYMLGTEFYITESSNEYCVYSLYPEYQPSETEPILHITAEICGLFLHIRYDKLELEKEFEDHLLREGVELLSWPYKDQMSNMLKFLICLDVHEKLTRQSFYKVPFQSHEHSREVPTCKSVSNYFMFTTYKGEHPKGFIETLYCPMHNILFLNKKHHIIPISRKTIEPYYIAQSVNPNCVYKMGIKGTMNQPQMHNNLSHEVFIRGEICGIFGTVNRDVPHIESKLLSNWNTIPREGIESGGELVNMGFTYQAQLCGSVYRKIYSTGYLYDDEDFSRPRMREVVVLIGKQILTINVLQCLMEKFNSESVILLASSASLGCVYKLDYSYPSAKIQFEICDVYPARYLLQMPRLKTVDPML